MSEYRMGKAHRGLLKSAAALVVYAVVPLLILTFIGRLGITVDLSGLEDVLVRLAMASPVMAIAAFPAGYYAKGNRARPVAWAVYTVVFVVVILFATGFGSIEGLVTIENGDVGMTVGITVLGLIGVLILFRLLKLVVIFMDNRDHREEFLEENGITAEEAAGDQRIVRVRGRYD